MRWRAAPVELRPSWISRSSQGFSSSTHSLPRRHLNELASGNVTSAIVSQLKAAQTSKHLLLFETAKRLLLRTSGSDDRARLLAATQLLERVQDHRPASITHILASPQFGAWASACAFSLRPTDPDI